jgi:kumamolisin
MPHHHYHAVHPRRRGVRVRSHADAGFPEGSLSPAQVLRAMGFSQNQYAGIPEITIGVGSLGGGVVQADIDNAVDAWGMAAPEILVRTVGGASNDPSDQESNVENMLDLLPTIAHTWWWLTGQRAKAAICFGPNKPGGMTAVTRDLASLCGVISWSWGSPAVGWDPVERAMFSLALTETVFAGCTVCAASGDNSIDDGTMNPTADYPCSDPSVWGVGGTYLSLKPDGSIALETAWGDGLPGDAGGGGGIDPKVPQPIFQSGVVLGAHRGVPDTAANADPRSGWQMSANGSWTVVGGTSAASPLTAALIAIAKGVAAREGRTLPGLLTPRIYAVRASAMRDILTGSNGARAAVGWDQATGLGSPNGPAFIEALSAP